MMGVGIQHPYSSRINPFTPTVALHSYSCRFSCKNSRINSVSLHPISVADRVLMDIQNSGIIACLRAQSAELAVEAARAALRGGVSVLEITMSTPGVFEALQCLVQEFPSASIGVGTVLDRQNAKDAVNLGAKFLLSPAMVKGILSDVAEGQALYIPGATTPTEILSASNDGAKIIKVYPVSAVGGAEYLAAVKKPFPHIPMVASQGMTLDSVGVYIGEGASAVVLSDAIFDKRAMAERDLALIYQLACSAAIKGNQAVRIKITPIALALLMGFALWCYVATTPLTTELSNDSPAASSSWWWPDAGGLIAKRHRRLQSCSVACQCGCCGGICNACCDLLNKNGTV